LRRSAGWGGGFGHTLAGTRTGTHLSLPVVADVRSDKQRRRRIARIPSARLRLPLRAPQRPHRPHQARIPARGVFLHAQQVVRRRAAAHVADRPTAGDRARSWGRRGRAGGLAGSGSAGVEGRRRAVRLTGFVLGPGVVAEAVEALLGV
jgi:hypothetical protein